MGGYEDLVHAHEGKAAPRDMTARWSSMTPLQEAPEAVLTRVDAFCELKRVQRADLEALGTRMELRGRGPDVYLAWAGWGRLQGRRVVTAIKRRHLSSGRREAEPGSTHLEPLVIGDRSSPDWFLAEGETDAARLHGLVGDAAAIVVLPAGALAFRESWAGLIPRGATCYLAHDADEAGDEGARKASRALGGRTVRVRPPEGAKDWCEWDGDRTAFVGLVASAKALARSRVKTFDELLAAYAEERSGPELEPVRLGFGSIDVDLRGISAGQVCGIAARTAVGKTWVLATIAHTFTQRNDSGLLVLSLEMPGTEWAERQLAIHADLAPEEIEQAARRGQLGTLASDFLEQHRNAVLVDELLALNTLPQVFVEARQRLRVPLRLVAIDYLGLLGADGKDAYERASALGKGLKQVAKEENVAIVVAAQVSRAGGDGSEPITISMLRDSGVLEESLDFLLGCWRPEKARNLNPAEAIALRDVMRVAVLKNRKGADGRIVDLRFHKNSRRLYEPTQVT